MLLPLQLSVQSLLFVQYLHTLKSVIQFWLEEPKQLQCQKQSNHFHAHVKDDDHALKLQAHS